MNISEVAAEIGRALFGPDHVSFRAHISSNPNEQVRIIADTVEPILRRALEGVCLETTGYHMPVVDESKFLRDADNEPLLVVPTFDDDDGWAG